MIWNKKYLELDSKIASLKAEQSIIHSCMADQINEMDRHQQGHASFYNEQDRINERLTKEMAFLTDFVIREISDIKHKLKVKHGKKKKH